MNPAKSAANRLDGIVPKPKAPVREQVDKVMRFYRDSKGEKDRVTVLPQSGGGERGLTLTYVSLRGLK